MARRRLKTQVIGLDELKRKLEALPKGFDARVIDSGLRASAKPVLKRSQELVPQPGVGQGYATGELRDSLVIRKVTKREKGAAGHFRLGALAPLYRLLHLVEFGTGPRVQASTGKATGAAPPQPFMRPALDEKAGEAITTFNIAMQKALVRITKKIASGYQPKRRR